MRVDEQVKRFEVIAAARPVRNGPVAADEVKWFVDALSAIESVFPPNHTIRRVWQEHVSRGRTYHPVRPVPPEFYVAEELAGVFASALGQLRSGLLTTLSEGVRAETAAELLVHADGLRGAGHQVAAMVLAGGALETHLRTLCVRHQLMVVGPSSIEKLNQALAHARNNGTQTISAVDTKQVTAWGDDRNAAAHRPTEFAKSADEVGLIIEGVRQFIARTT